MKISVLTAISAFEFALTTALRDCNKAIF